jgi:hypothetical protein
MRGQPKAVHADEVSSSLRGKWIVFAGDSTHRLLRAEFIARLIHTFGMYSLRASGQAYLSVEGRRIFDNDHQKDADAEGDVRCSLRFLRGLDLDKMSLHAADWRRRLFYPDMASPIAPQALLPFTYRTVLQADPPTQGRGANYTAEPDIIVLHSCAWDLPSLNRSSVHFPLLESKRKCPRDLPTSLRVLPFKWQNVTRETWPSARVMASPCIRRGDGLSDAEIYSGFVGRLHAAIDLVRASFKGRLIIRNCHAGTLHQPRRSGDWDLSKLLVMNEHIARVVAERRVELMDVFAIDRELTGHPTAWHHGNQTDFHVPQAASSAAALAMIWQLHHGTPPKSLAEIRREWQVD